jgi:hypothetical protein
MIPEPNPHRWLPAFLPSLSTPFALQTLKEDVAEMKKREAQNEKLMYEIAQENKRLSEPLTKALKEVSESCYRFFGIVLRLMRL